MAIHRKSLLSLLVFVILLSCTRDPQQIPVVVSDPKAIRASTLQVLGRRDGSRAGGTGFFVAHDKIATNIHIIAGVDPISAHVKSKGTIWSIQGVTAYDVNNDLAVLKISGRGKPFPISDSDTVRIGDPITVVGYPNRRYEVTEGIVHGIHNSDKRLWIRAKLSGGNSGSPVLNNNGRVIGIAHGRIGSRDDSSNSYAIPSNVLRALLDQSGSVEPLETWQNQAPIRAYIYFVQSEVKRVEADYSSEIVNLDKTIELNPDFVWAYYNRGYAKYLLAQSKANQGDVAAVQQLYQDALDDYTHYIKRDPGHATTYYNRGIAQYRIGRLKADQGDVAEAQSHFQDAIDNHTEAIQLKLEFVQVYIGRARAKHRLAQSKATEGHIAAARNLYKAAIADRTRAIQLEPKNAKLYNGRGWAVRQVGQFEAEKGHASEARSLYKAAIDDYTQAIQLDSENAHAYNNRGYAKYLICNSEAETGNREEAKKLYEAALIDVDKSIQLDSNNENAYHNRGVIKIALGDAEGAIIDFDSAIEINPKYAEARYQRGLAKETLGQQKAAKADFQKAKELDPNVGQ